MVYNIGMNKKQTNFRLTPKAKALVIKMATELGISQTAIVELAIQEKAKRDGVKLD